MSEQTRGGPQINSQLRALRRFLAKSPNGTVLVEVWSTMMREARTVAETHLGHGNFQLEAG